MLGSKADFLIGGSYFYLILLPKLYYLELVLFTLPDFPGLGVALALFSFGNILDPKGLIALI